MQGGGGGGGEMDRSIKNFYTSETPGNIQESIEANMLKQLQVNRRLEMAIIRAGGSPRPQVDTYIWLSLYIHPKLYLLSGIFIQKVCTDLSSAGQGPG